MAEVRIGIDKRTKGSMFSVFLAEEADTTWVPWDEEADGTIVEAEARVSKQQFEGTDDYCVGRVRFTGQFRSGNPVLKASLNSSNSTERSVEGFANAPCYYEGDLDTSTLHPSGGQGSFHVGYECREVYRGDFTDLCRTAKSDEKWSGAARGSGFGALFRIYLRQRSVFLRGWMPVFVHGVKSRTSHVEVRVPEGGDVSTVLTVAPNGVVCYPDGEVADLDMIKVGSHEVGVPPKMIEWITGTARPALPWIGATHLRPSSIAACESSDGRCLVWHTDWASAEGIYPHGEAVVLRHDTTRSPTRVLHLAIGVFDFSPERHEATAVTESAEDSGEPAFGLTHEFPWSGLLHADNAVAVMFSPFQLCRDTTAGQKINAAWSKGSHGECLVFFSLLPDDAKGEECRDHLAHTFNGRPVVMDPQWVLDRFPDQYTVARTCPNMPVSLEVMRSQTPVFNPRVMQMMCPVVLSDLNNIDSRTGAMAQVTPQTPGTSSVPNKMPRWVSVLWPTVQRDLRFGFAPVTWQVLLHGFGGRGFISEYPDRALFPAPYQVTTAASFPASELPLQNNAMVFKPHGSGPARVIAANQYGGRKNPLKYITDAPPGLVLKSDKCIINLDRVTYIRGGGKTPYVLTFSLQPATRSKYITKGKYLTKHYTCGYAVSATYLRTYYNPLVLQMAVREIWDASRFSKNLAKGGSAIISSNFSSGRMVECTSPDTWPHYTSKLIELVGAHPNSQEDGAGCLRGAVRAALEASTSRDEGALAALDSWDEWAEFESLPNRVQLLNDSSTAARRYRVLTFKQRAKTAEETPSRWSSGGVWASPATARCAFTLILSPQGRARLLAVGIDRVIFRPLSPSGWKNHAMAAVVRSDGLWYLLVPDAGGESHKSTLLHGMVPGVSCVMGAYALSVASRKRGKDAPPDELRTLVKRKTGVHKGKFIFPEPPTLLEARYHQEGAYMDFAFRAWVGVVADPSRCHSALQSRAQLGPVLFFPPFPPTLLR